MNPLISKNFKIIGTLLTWWAIIMIIIKLVQRTQYYRELTGSNVTKFNFTIEIIILSIGVILLTIGLSGYNDSGCIRCHSNQLNARSC